MIECISLHSRTPIPIPQKTLLAVGSFDGVHLAHRCLLNRANAWRDQAFSDAAVGVFCFRDLPSHSLGRESIGQLCTLSERLDRFSECGMELAILADFSDLREFSPEAYIKQFLQERCHAVALACGFNHRFGKGGRGTPSLLQNLMGSERVLICEQILQNGAPISSTRIRNHLLQGEVEEAALLLGRPYTVTAKVRHGKALGRTLGIPTVNQNFPPQAALPQVGVYASSCKIGETTYYGVSNVGVHPTVDEDAAVNCETYLIGYEGDLYGQTLTVSFLHFLRKEIKFSSVSELQAQIKADIQAVKDRMV